MEGKVVVIQEGTSWLPPLLVFSGAVIAAVLTALFAHARMKRQLSENRALQRENLEKQLRHDRDLRQQQLDHDRELQEDRLSHDQEVRRRESVRAFLDETVKRERAHRRTFQTLFDAFSKAEGESTDGHALTLAGHQRLLEFVATESSQRIDLLNDEVLLRTYIGDHPVLLAHERVVDLSREALDRLGDPPYFVRSEDHRTADLAAEAELQGAQSEYLLGLSMWHDPNLQAEVGLVASAQGDAGS